MNVILGIIQLYEQMHRRAPTEDYMQRILHITEMRGFPEMIGSIDCMHWEWKNCPKAWEEQYTREYKGTTTVILEAVATHDLWLWHAFWMLRHIERYKRSRSFTSFL